MNDKLNNNLEEFLNNSMDHFDDVPSNNVWDSVEQKLDGEMEEEKNKPFFFGWKFISSLIVIGILVASISVFQIKNNQEIKTIQDQLSQLENKNHINPNSEEKELSTLSTQVELKSLEEDELKANTKEQEPIKSPHTTQTTDQIISYNNSKNEYPSSKNKSKFNKTLSTFKNNIDTKNNIPNIFERSNAPLSIEDDLSNSESLTQVVKTAPERKNNNIISSKSTNTLKKNKTDRNSIPSDLSNRKNQTVIESLNSKLYFLPNNENQINLLNLSEPIIVNRPDSHFSSRYRIGLNARFANTFIKHNTDFNGTESYGIRHEYLLNDRWALTNSINFNIQHYDIIGESGIVEKAVVREYTNRDFNDISIREIDVNAEYIDIPLGLKWNFKETRRGWNYFINPSAVWQIYLPQMFSFTQTDQNVIVRNDSRIIASLGSASIDVGIEKRIGNHFYFQCSLWGEYSFIPLGTQQDKIKLVGVRTSLLFGK